MKTLPNISDLSAAILQVMFVGDVKSFREIDDLVAKHLNIPSDLLNQKRQGNRTEYGYRMAWAKQKLKASKNLENAESRGWKRIL